MTRTILVVLSVALLLLITSFTLGAGRSDISDAAMKGDKAAIRSLLLQKADVNAPQVDGATAVHWAVYRDAENPRLFVELFAVPSWEEHLRQHRERQTGTDLEYHDAAAALSDPPPQTDHYLAAAVQE